MKNQHNGSFHENICVGSLGIPLVIPWRGQEARIQSTSKYFCTNHTRILVQPMVWDQNMTEQIKSTNDSWCCTKPWSDFAVEIFLLTSPCLTTQKRFGLEMVGWTGNKKTYDWDCYQKFRVCATYAYFQIVRVGPAQSIRRSLRSTTNNCPADL